MQQQISFCSPLKYQSSPRFLRHHHLVLLPLRIPNLRISGDLPFSHRISEISHPILKIPNPAGNSITPAVAATKRKIRRRRQDGWRDGVESALLRCIALFVAQNLNLLPEPLGSLLLLSDGGGRGGGGLGFWKKGFGGGGGSKRWKLGFIILVLILGAFVLLILGEWMEGDILGFGRVRFRMLLKRLGRRGRRRRRRRRIWAL